MSTTSLQVPPSPSSSKRSRSKDSAHSTATSSLDTPHFTPAASTQSLVIPNPGEQPSNLQPAEQDPTPYPAFLRLSADIHQKFADLEWEQRQRTLHTLQNGDSEHPSHFVRCTGEEIKDRNRYMNVDPYQGNRVRLKVPEGWNDYINASPVELKSSGSDKVLKYIATQGPKYETYPHFWRMIWHETTSPAVIVMLTQTYEAAREKCFPYYPQQLDAPSIRVNAQNEYEDGFIHDLKLASLENRDDVRAQVRELDMTTEDGSESRKIWHLLFAGWPDFLVPEGADRAALLRLITMSREKNADNATNPRIVHCSAGVGRSGTFIALDWLLQELDDGSLDEVQDNEDPVFGVVSRLREQRMMMVQSEPQLAFIYDVVRERWRARWISQHPEEAESLGVTHTLNEAPEGPRLKRQKSHKNGAEGDEDERAELEAELLDAEMDFDKGKT
ncbi:tyrosine-protein phosphatase 2 [Bimuria novae-zelandiae CBS 107.79]|uniref:Tyrosine-protein phosphatase 2 n=1 Tax=Bimuria novae-zelandiae CBS 107.79 TaxID=1447943 RepID=A0A6A5VKA0_9PLEO|nr:tyrosine-protein phosphatase 2 [Bimuria novae-zelandiae CBS 107.79]